MSMQKTIYPSNVSLNIIAPPSKSSAIRFAAIALLDTLFNNSITEIYNYPVSEDTTHTFNIIKRLGFNVVLNNLKTLTISKNCESMADNEPIELNCGESALNKHIFSFVVSHLQKEVHIKGIGTLKRRNFYNLEKIIEQAGVGYIYNINDGYNIININKQLQSGKYEIDCAESSQHLTGLLIGLSYCKDQSTITTIEPYYSRYIDMTIDALSKFNIIVEVEKLIDNKKIYTVPSFNKHNYLDTYRHRVFIEGDWSAASNFFVLGAIAGNVTISNLNPNSLQPDSIILKLFERLNIQFCEISPWTFRISKSIYNGFDFDATAYPDLIPALVVLAFNAKTTSRIYGINRLTNKESNRKDILLKVFKMFGAKIDIQENSFIIKPSNISGGFADSHNDHRIAMAIAVAAKNAKTNITLTNAEATNKSFPDFWRTFEQ